MLKRARSFATGFVCLAVVAGCDSDTNKESKDAGRADAEAPEGQPDGGVSDAGDAASSPLPPEVVSAAKEWPVANRDYAGTRATFDSAIKSSNVNTLKEVWSFELPGAGTFGAGTACPLVLDGTVYYVDMQSNVFALDAQTGKARWEKRYNDAAAGPNGIAVGWGKLFVPSSDTSFVALDLKTGKELWKSPIEVPKNGGIGVAPIAYGGLVYLSTEPVNTTSQYLGGVNGTFYALDQETGKVVWSFKTVQDETLWGHADLNSGGGAWYPPTVDVARNVMYWGVGNPAAYPGTAEFPNGSSHPGDNLYTNSVVALSYDEGKLLWYHQERPHDFFDLDFQNPPIPVQLKIGGAERNLVIGSGKTGTVAALDADNKGALVWRTPVGKHENDTLSALPDAGAVVFPGDLGGVETPLAYAEGSIYVATANQGRQFFPTRSGDLDDVGTGELVALDASSGSVRWKADLAAQPYASVTVVNDIVLTATADGTVYFFDRQTGKEVWRYVSSIGINAPISIAGDLVLIPAGAGIGIPKLIALRLP
jgi:glucose dehydrogenase